MTTRVFECERRDLISVAEPRAGARTARLSRTAGVKAAALAALVVVPLAGASEAPRGWLVASVTALVVLCLALIVGRRVRWGWLLLFTAAAGVAAPRGQWSLIGPSLFVATALCLVLWFANSDARRRNTGEVRPGSHEHAAQLMMGLSGERHVGQVLARELPQPFAVINGLKLPRGAGDIDHLVIGPTGLFLLETKTMAGHIVCGPDGSWRRTRVGRGGTAYAAFIGDPATQVQRNIFAVRQVLQQQLPELFRGTPLWIEGLVVFPHPQTELETEHSRVPAVLLHEVTARICRHPPRRRLKPNEIDGVVAALLYESQSQRKSHTRQSAQSLVELALLLPLVLTLVFGTIAISRLVQAQTAVVAVAHEAARAGALANTPSDASKRMRERAALVAPGLGIDARLMLLDWDTSHFMQDPGKVVAVVRYPVDLSGLPLVGWIGAPAVRAEHVEWLDPFRSGLGAQAGSAE